MQAATARHALARFRAEMTEHFAGSTSRHRARESVRANRPVILAGPWTAAETYTHDFGWAWAWHICDKTSTTTTYTPVGPGRGRLHGQRQPVTEGYSHDGEAEGPGRPRRAVARPGPPAAHTAAIAGDRFDQMTWRDTYA